MVNSTDVVCTVNLVEDDSANSLSLTKAGGKGRGQAPLLGSWSDLVARHLVVSGVSLAWCLSHGEG